MITKKISLDTWHSNYVTVYANRGELDSRYIEVSFKDQEQKNIDLSDKTVTFYAIKPDGTQIFNSCEINSSSNTATIELTSQTLSLEGILNCEFQIFKGNSVLLKVNGLKIIVSSANDFSEAIESTSEFNTLINAINTAQNFSDNASNAVQGIKINGTPVEKDSNNIVNIVTSSNGIATIQQGSWTPEATCLGGTAPVYTTNLAKGEYILIGNIVYITFYLSINISTPGTLNALVSGLPFNGLNGTIRQGISVTEVKGAGLSTDTIMSVMQGTKYIRLCTIAGVDQPWGSVGNAYIGGSGFYIIDPTNS